MWLKKHWITITVIMLATATSGLFIAWAFYDGEQSDARHHQKIADTNKTYDALIKKLKAEREAKELAAKKAAAEEKARKEAAAKAATTEPAPKSSFASGKTCNTSSSHNDPRRLDIIVNKRNCLIPLSYAPTDLVTAYGATLRSEAATQFGTLVNAAQANGVQIGATSSYRSYEAQVATYQHWVNVNGSMAAADKVSARAGYSEHQTGLAVDVSTGGCSLDCFAGTAAYAWMKKNAYKYGFIERYPPGLTHITGYSPEAWHYRYVGKAVASAMKTSGVKTLEEYFSFPAAPTY